MFIQYAHKKLKQIKVAKEKLGKPGMKTIYNQIQTDKYKTSAVEVEAMMKRFGGCLAKADDMVIASKNLIEVTAAMDGTVVLRHLNIKNKGKEYLLAELDITSKTKSTGSVILPNKSWPRLKRSYKRFFVLLNAID
jgi:mannose/fructose/N-acetylgalactosamine-specific phosphotransferase system component IIB